MPERRPRWAINLRMWLTDGQYDHLPDDAADWRWNWRESFLSNPGAWLLCLVFGHEAVPDQCNIPDHDFCAFCSKSMPGQASVRPT